MEGELVCSAEQATESLALSLRDYAGPQMTIDPIPLKTGNGTVNYAGSPTVANSAISFTDYIGQATEEILLAWYSMAHNIMNDKIGFKEYYSQDGLLYKWAPNGTRQISWWLMGCWINEYNQGQFSRQNPELRQFSTNIIYDKPIPYARVTKQEWYTYKNGVAGHNLDESAYTNYNNSNYLGTLGKKEEINF